MAYLKKSVYNRGRKYPYRRLRVVVRAAGEIVAGKPTRRKAFFNRSGHAGDTGTVRDDWKKVSQDWKVVGNDLRKGIDEYAGALSEKQRRRALRGG